MNSFALFLEDVSKYCDDGSFGMAVLKGKIDGEIRVHIKLSITTIFFLVEEILLIFIGYVLFYQKAEERAGVPPDSDDFLMNLGDARINPLTIDFNE